MVDGVSSSKVLAVSGVPQGSVLGPLLFKLYINGVRLTTGSKLMLYADDLILYKPIKKQEDYIDVQKDLDTLNAWSDCSRLMFNPHKCKYNMVISRKKANLLVPPLITLGSSAIERTYSYKYLAVSISSDLSWSDHIHNICTRARRTIGLLYRHFYLNSNSTSLQKLYLTLVRPLLEYACQVWHPHLVRDIAKLERVQKLALRLCTKQWTLDYSTLLSLCS